ncbi:vancomycin high temperature exclusion protein [uncultured Eubacterium sp.]|uniref:SanA/YdcF family protein n=1 Tax=uncultured Eubacterium sp. TaxID=165185 RepID=UPI002673368A|nr:ElyC/SanA/YdcF family protein [uncultured Eubacterium sp.]
MKNIDKQSEKNNNSVKTKKGVKKLIIKIIFWIIFLCVLLVLSVTGINLYMTGSVKDNILSLDEAKDLGADCIIVLGAGVRNDNTPTKMLEDRIIIGDRLYNENAANKIIMSGDHGRKEYDEVNVMKKYAIDEGIPSEDIFMDHAGFETYDTMYRAKEIFGVKKVVIVTQKYHLYRALYIAKSLGLEAYGVSSDLRYYSKKMAYWKFREYIARVKAFGKCIWKPESQYLGEPIDIKASGDVTNDKK